MINFITQYAWAILLMVTLLSVTYLTWSREESANSNESGKSSQAIRSKTTHIENKDVFRGYVFNPINWNLVFRPAASLLLGLLYTGLIFALVYSFIWLSDLDFYLPWYTWLVTGLVFAIWAALPEGGETESVPETNFYSMVTFWGMPIGWLFRSTGNYEWTGKKLGLGHTQRTVQEFTDANGYIKGGEIPFKVWNNADSQGVEEDGKTKKGNTIIKAPAKNRADISATLTLILQSVDPKKTLDSDDPALDIGERSRQEFREMVNHFVDTDLPHLQQYTSSVLTGSELITCFLPGAVHGQKAGGMILDNGGKVMFEVLDKNLSKEDRGTAIEIFKERVKGSADRKMLAGVMKKGVDDVKIDSVQVKAPIDEVIRATGFKLVRATFGDIILSEPVSEAANSASAELDQRIIQIESARTNREARKEMLPTEEEIANPGWQDAMYLQAAQDNKDNISIVIVPGADPLTKAAVAGANQLNKGKKEK